MASQEYRTTCTRDCPDACGIIATVDNGRITAQKGDPEHGITRGFLCSRGNDFLKRFYDANRLLYPQRRTAHGWQRLSWDEALDLTADKLAHFRDNFGPRSVLVVNYSGMRGWFARIMTRLFWAHFGGGTFSSGGLSTETFEAAQHLDLGGDGTHDPEDLANSAAFVLWGKNVYVTHQHWTPFINRARKKGATLMAVDPVHTPTAQKADRFYQIRPGSDGLLAIGVARRLLEWNAVDARFIADHTNGFDAYRQLVFSHSMEEVAGATDLAVEEVDQIAELYATKKPLATIIGLGPSYWANGGENVRLIDALAAMSGNVGVSGGGASSNLGAPPPFDLSMLHEAPRGEVRRVLLPRLGDDVLAAGDPPLKMGWIAGANPAAAAPNTNHVKEGLRSLEFLVVVEQFMSATAELADLVLPCTTYLEMDDLVTSYGHSWLGLCRQIVPPQGETKPDGEIMQLLARRLGFGEALAGGADEWIGRLLAPLASQGVTLESLRRQPRRNPLAPAVPFSDRRFRTPSGRFEFISRFSPTDAGRDGLHLIATKTLRMLNSQVLPEDLPEEPAVRVNPATASGLGLSDGQRVWVSSRVGEVKVRLLADERVRPDVVLFNPAAWKGDLSGVNQLRETLLTDIGDGAAMHETTVTLRPA
ncbi:MAG: molybdopterin-containing oxidoreductase family protein [Chloroflexota bacterium]